MRLTPGFQISSKAMPWVRVHQQRLLDLLDYREWARTNLNTPTRLTVEEANQFAAHVLGDLATRPKKPRGTPMAGKHISRQGVKHLHGSDLVERIYVCVEAYRLADLTIWRACEKLAEHSVVAQKLGLDHQPRRGRQRKTRLARGWIDIVENVRTLYYSFKKKKPWSEWAFPFWWSNYQFHKEHVESEGLGRKNRAVLRWY